MATECEEEYEEEDFRDIVEESVRESLIGEIEDVWGEMHHNATLLGSWQDFENDYEGELFWNVLGDYAYDAIEMLQDDLYEKFGVVWNLYQYGRGGATIAPAELSGATCCGGYGELDWEKVNYYSEVEDLDAILAGLEYINTQVRDFCNHIDDWWKSMKELNEWDKEIAEHNEKS